MLLLLLSLVALALGPGIVALAGSRSWVLSLVDGFVIVTIGGIALIHILPHALLSCGGWAFLGAGVGLFAPMLLEKKDHPKHDAVEGGDTHTHRPVAALALLGIAMHAFLDGSAFTEHGHEHGGEHELLGLAVVLHRVPEGLAIWWLARPKRAGRVSAIVALAIVATATVLGARFGDALVQGTTATIFSFVQAIVAGSLLHVILHHAPAEASWHHHHHHAAAARAPRLQSLPHIHGHDHAHDHDHDFQRALDHALDHEEHGPTSEHMRIRAAYASLADPDPHHGRGLALAPALGASLGIALLFYVSTSHPTAQRIAHEIGMGPTFLTLALESAPALLVAYVASGLVHAFLPRSVVAWLGKGGPFSQSLRGLLVGPLLPVCSCGVLPLYRSMLARGAPRAAALTLLIAAPEIGLAAFLVSWSLLGPAITIARAICAIITALAVGYGVTRLARKSTRPVEAIAAPSLSPPPSFNARVWSGIRYGLGDTVDHTSPWIMLGLALAAFAEPLLDGEQVARVSPWVEVPSFAAIGVPLYVCASGATPLVAVLLHKGVSPGAAIAFLLTGPATNLTTFGVLKSLHGKRLATLFAIAMVVVPTILGCAVNAVLPRERPEALHTAAHASATPLEMVCLAALVVLVAVSLVRHGPRHMVAQLVTGGAHEH